MRDLIVKDDDLVAATHGRGFWILDDITPLRQIDAASAAKDAILFKPTTAWRVRWNTSTDMPWPKEEPTGANPPDGAIINYYLKAAASGPVTLEILRQDGRLVRRYSSDDPVTPIPDRAERAGAHLLVSAAAGALDRGRACTGSSGTFTTSRWPAEAAAGAAACRSRGFPTTRRRAEHAVGDARHLHA